MRPCSTLSLLLALLALPAGAAEKPARKGPATNDFVFLGARPVLVRLHVTRDGKPVAEAWDQVIDRLFKYLDVNGDGVLDRAEAERAPSAQVLLSDITSLFNQRGGRRASIFNQLDANGDGKVTRDELAAYYRGNGFTPFQVTAGPKGNASALDAALFGLLDTNRDGKLSREELAAAPQVLAKLDADDDEMISLAEVPGSGADDELAQLAVRLRRLPPQATGHPSFVPLSGPESGRSLALALLERYGKGDRKDRKTLTAADLSLDPAAFRLLDRNGDGELDAEELAEFGSRPADLEFQVRSGKTDGQAVVPFAPAGKPAPLAGALKGLEKGPLSLEMGVERVDIGVAEEASGTFRVVPKLREQILTVFRTADQDRKGYLDRKDAEKTPIFGSVFHMMDRNSDGKLEEKEVVAFLEALEGMQAAARASCVSLVVSEPGRGLFDLMDTNHDGRLSVRELRGAVKLIAALDRDGDGCLGRPEIPRRYSLAFRQGLADPNAGFRVVLAGRVPGGNPRGRESEKGPVWFRKMDRNRDGDVSRKEFLGSDEEFRAIDEDGDGLLSLAEAERWDARQRAGR